MAEKTTDDDAENGDENEIESVDDLRMYDMVVDTDENTSLSIEGIGDVTIEVVSYSGEPGAAGQEKLYDTRTGIPRTDFEAAIESGRIVRHQFDDGPIELTDEEAAILGDESAEGDGE